VTYRDGEDGVTVCWDVDAANDLSEYLLTYTIMDSFYPLGHTVTERILATVPYSPGAKQCWRIGGLVMGDATISFLLPGDGLAAKDASGNISGFGKPLDHGTSGSGGVALFGPAAPVLSGTVSSGNANLSWDTSVPATAYDLFYAREAYAGPQTAGSGASQGNSPIHIDSLAFNGNYTVSGLKPGYWYAFAVRRYGLNSQAPPSLLSNQKWLLITSGVDSNGDGCPDDWEVAHKPYKGGADPDGDGLTTAQECKLGTDPGNADTDGDGTVDGGETQGGSDPQDPGSVPQSGPGTAQTGVVPPVPATLSLSDTTLDFVAYTQGLDPAPQSVVYSNVGSGSFTVALSSNKPWLSAKVVGKNIVVSVTKAGVARGTYDGAIQVNAKPGSTLGSPQTIYVHYVVLAGYSPNKTPLFLPQISRK
jgi:hypothetical protein